MQPEGLIVFPPHSQKRLVVHVIQYEFYSETLSTFSTIYYWLNISGWTQRWAHLISRSMWWWDSRIYFRLDLLFIFSLWYHLSGVQKLQKKKMYICLLMMLTCVTTTYVSKFPSVYMTWENNFEALGMYLKIFTVFILKFLAPDTVTSSSSTCITKQIKVAK